MTINEVSGVTPYRQVMADIRQKIATGALAVGEQLPTLKTIVSDYGVSMATAAKALDGLREQGVIRTVRGRGSYVAEPPEVIRYGAGRYRAGDGESPTGNELRSGGNNYTLSASISTTNATRQIAAKLGISPGDALSVAQYRWVTDDGEPFQHSAQYEALALTRGTNIERPPESGVPDVIARFGSIGYYVDQVVERTRSRMPSSDESRDLHIPEGVPVLVIERIHYAGSLAVETADIVIRADRVVITTVHAVDNSAGGAQ